MLGGLLFLTHPVYVRQQNWSSELSLFVTEEEAYVNAMHDATLHAPVTCPPADERWQMFQSDWGWNWTRENGFPGPTMVLDGPVWCTLQYACVICHWHSTAVECLSRVTLVAEVNAGFHVSIIGAACFPFIIIMCPHSRVIIISIIITHHVSFSSLETLQRVLHDCTLWG